MKVVIVGGVAGGMSAAARLRRLQEDAEIIVFEGGNYVSFANCGLPYHVAGEITDRDALILHTPETLAARAALDVRLGWTVTSIDRAAQTVTAAGPGGQTVTESYDALLLSPGTKSIIPPIPGIDDPRVHTLRTIDEMDALEADIASATAKAQAAGRKLRAVVLGAGFIGLEAAEALSHRGAEVTIVEGSPHVLPPLDAELAVYLRKEFERHGVRVIEGTSLTAVSPSAEELGVTLSDGGSLSADLIVMSVGARARSELAVEAGLDTDERGNILVDANHRTNDPHIWAVGDAISVKFADGRVGPVQLAGPANRQGRRAADVISGLTTVPQAPVLATAVVRVFSQVAAMTGANRRTLDAAGVDYETIRIHPGDHAGYYPGVKTVHLMGFFERATGKLLGAASVGPLGGVDKRIDVLATAIRSGMTAEDLAELELCYSPPVGSAKDPINMLGFTMLNVSQGLVKQWESADIDAIRASGATILDVRSPGERKNTGYLEGSVNIPLPQLRGRVDELKGAGQPIYVHCASGVRSYLASRILQQNGFDARNHSGGFISIIAAAPEKIVRS